MEYHASAKRQTDSACRMLAFRASCSKWHSWPRPQVGATGLAQGSVLERRLDSLSSPPTLATRHCVCGRIDLDFSQSRQKGFGQEAAHLQQQAKETQRGGAREHGGLGRKKGGEERARRGIQRANLEPRLCRHWLCNLDCAWKGKESRGDDRRRRTLITKDILPSTTRSANTGDHSLTYPQRSKIEQ